MDAKSKTQGERPPTLQAVDGDTHEQWLRPWTGDDDVSEWETLPMPADQPRGPRGSHFTVDLDAEQTAWLYRQSEAAGVTPIDLLRKLVDDARSPERH